MKEQTKNRLVGYARVSTNGQELKLQLDALEKAGCPKKLIFVDKVSGAKAARPGLDACLRELKEGDTLIAWRLDRLGRSVRHLIDLVEQLRQRKVGFKSLCDGAIDTTTASGELIFHIFTALAQFERRLIQERTRAGLEAARARGRKGGRKPIAVGDPRSRWPRSCTPTSRSPSSTSARPCGFPGRRSTGIWRRPELDPNPGVG
ncbi:MAG: recombinase family protein [Verrucomicrobia bacterium]|nr:recombinase family protein [Verrucomicrobiota bacterium]